MKTMSGTQWMAGLLALPLMTQSVRGGTEVEVARKPQGPWTAYATRTLQDLPRLAL